MSKAIDDLRHEHDAIISALHILEAITARIDRGLDVDRKGIRDFISFLKEFADKCHHGKEEGILFPALVKAGIPERGGPVGVMLAEHEKGRNLIRQMESSAGSADYQGLARAAKEYAALLRSHIEKENEVLFPSAEKALTEPQLVQISESFAQHEEKVIGAGRHEELHGILRALKQKYLA